MSTSYKKKALAIATATCMSTIGVAGLPATALDGGQADQTQVALAPTAGTAYGTIAAAQDPFSLSANESARVAGGDMRFVIEDTTGNIVVTAGSTNVAVDADDVITVVIAGDDIDQVARTAAGVVTITDAVDADDAYANFAAGDIINIDAELNGIAAGNYVLTAATADSISFIDGGAVLAAEDADAAADIAVLENGDGNRVNRTTDADGNYEPLVISTNSADQTVTEVLVIAPVQSDDTYSVDVTALVDDNENDTVDLTEFRSATRTVTFYDASELNLTDLTWTAVLGANAASLEATVSPTLNYSYSETPTATLRNAEGDFADGATVALEDGVLTISDDADADGGVIQAGLLTAVVSVSDGDTLDTERFNVRDNNVRNMHVTMTDSASTAFTQTSDVDEDLAMNDQDGPTATAKTDSNQTVVVTVYNDDGSTVSGAVVTADDAAGPNIASADAGVYTVAGEDVAADGTFDAVSVTTNSSGQATFQIVVVDADEAAAADVISMDFTVEGVTAGFGADLDADGTLDDDEISPNADIQITYADVNHTVAITSIVHAEAADASQAGNATGEAAFAGSVAYSVKLTDQFGEAPTDTMRLRGQFVQDTETTNFFADVVNGEATLNIADNSAADGGEIAATFTIQSYDADLQNWAQNTDVTWTDENAGNSGSFFVDPTAVAAGIVNITNDAPNAVAVGVTALAAANELEGEETPDWVADNTAVTLNGTAEVAATGAAITGVPVTISGADHLIFEADGVYAFGSLTAWSAGDDGAWEFDVYSTTSGEFEVTIAAAGGTSTATVEFSAAAADVDNGVITVTMPAETIYGNTYEVSVLLTDAFGNVVDNNDGDMSVLFSGAGNIVGNAPTETDEDGLMTFDIALTGAVASNASLTVTYAGVDGDIDATDDNVSKVTNFNITAPVVVTADSVLVSGVVEVVAGEAATYTATVVDADGEALAGRTVTFTEAGVGEITMLSGVTDADGQATTMLVTSTVGNSYITAMVDGKSHTLLVKVVAPAEPEPETEPETEPEPVGKVNVGTFNGKVVVYALGLEGSTVSWKIAGKWQKVEVTDSALQRYDRPTAAIGVDIKVDIYVDGELRLSKTVTTK